SQTPRSRACPPRATMPALYDLQVALRDVLLGGDSTAAVSEIAHDGLLPEARLAIYRHHIFFTLTESLKSIYSVVCHLVDERFFAYAADCYIRKHPPTAPCLFEYGPGFADFLAGFEPCGDLPYLPDVARLEWARNVALHAEDVAGIDPTQLSGVPADELPRLRFKFEPSV